MSMMTSVIGALFISSAIWLGWQAWLIDEQTSNKEDEVSLPRHLRPPSVI